MNTHNDISKASSWKETTKKVGSKFKEGKTLSDEFNWSKCWIQMKILQQHNDPHTFNGDEQKINLDRNIVNIPL